MEKGNKRYVTCPKCKAKAEVAANACVPSYKCKECGEEIKAKEGKSCACCQ